MALIGCIERINLFSDSIQDRFCFCYEPVCSRRRAEVRGQKSRQWREITQYGMPTAQLSGNTGHPRPAETIEYDVTRLGIVLDVPHDCFMRYFSMIRMRVINWVILPFADISYERLKRFPIAVRIFGAISLPFGNKVVQPWIWACCVIRRIRKRKNCFVRALWETFLIAKSRVAEFLTQQSQKMFAARVVAGERLPETVDRLRASLLMFQKIIHLSIPSASQVMLRKASREYSGKSSERRPCRRAVRSSRQQIAASLAVYRPTVLE